jgi:hypothetical protein
MQIEIPIKEVIMAKIREEIIAEVGKMKKSQTLTCSVDVFAQGGSRAVVTYCMDDDGATLEKNYDWDRKEGDSPFLRLGETYTIKIKSTVSGYLHVFNLGTSGAIAKMFPKSLVDNYVHAGVEFYVLNEFFETNWYENGPITASTENSECFLLILTTAPKTIYLSDLHIDLAKETDDRITRGSLGKETDGFSDLYSRTDGSVHIGVYEFDVL